MKKAAKLRAKARQKAGNSNARAIEETPEFAYILGGIEERITLYAESAGLSRIALAAELGRVLQRKNRR